MRVPFALVEIEVRKLYNFSLTDSEEIEQQCEYARQYILVCGWEIEDYIWEMLGCNKLSN